MVWGSDAKFYLDELQKWVRDQCSFREGGACLALLLGKNCLYCSAFKYALLILHLLREELLVLHRLQGGTAILSPHLGKVICLRLI